MMGVSVLLWYVILNVLFVNIGKFNIYLVWCNMRLSSILVLNCCSIINFFR